MTPRKRKSIHIWILMSLGLLLIAALSVLGSVASAAFPTEAVNSSSAEVTSQQTPPFNVNDPYGIADFNCADIARFGVDKQLNVRAQAILAKCSGQGEKPPVSSGPSSGPTGIEVADRILAPFTYGGTDINLITGAETSPNVTQSETFVWGSGNTVVVGYNDSRGRNAIPINISGASVSTDGGTTFTRLTNGTHSPFPSTLGDPVVLYDPARALWLTVWLDQTCGSQGLGGYRSATPANPASWTHFCVHVGTSDDRESGWVDSNPASPFYGRVYITWNNFAIGGGALFVTYSDNAGTTWSIPTQIFPSFQRNVQLTGDSANGNLYLATMDEQGGGLTNRINKIWRSTNGGVTWTNTYTGPLFPGPGRSSSGYFATMYASPAYWRHMGWGQPGAYNNVVHLVYASRNTGNGDPGNVFYIRSIDSGATFSPPVQMNTDATTRAQWQPNLSVGSDGTVFVGWYDERNGSGACQPSSPNNPCYERFGRSSMDGGLTWQTDMSVSDVVSPLPLQPDPGIQTTYAGDYDYASANGTTHYQTWVDGRVSINNASQQDSFFDKIPLVEATATPTSTATPTNTPVPPTSTPTRGPCSLCNTYVKDVDLECNNDGTYHWIAVVRNNAQCTVVTTWEDRLQIQRNYGGWTTVRTQTGTGVFPPGDTTIDGNYCYVAPPPANVTGVRHIFRTTGTPSGCRTSMTSNKVEPCPVVPTCQLEPTE